MSENEDVSIDLQGEADKFSIINPETVSARELRNTLRGGFFKYLKPDYVKKIRVNVLNFEDLEKEEIDNLMKLLMEQATPEQLNALAEKDRYDNPVGKKIGEKKICYLKRLDHMDTEKLGKLAPKTLGIIKAKQFSEEQLRYLASKNKLGYITLGADDGKIVKIMEKIVAERKQNPVKNTDANRAPVQTNTNVIPTPPPRSPSPNPVSPDIGLSPEVETTVFSPSPTIPIFSSNSPTPPSSPTDSNVITFPSTGVITSNPTTPPSSPNSPTIIVKEPSETNQKKIDALNHKVSENNLIEVLKVPGLLKHVPTATIDKICRENILFGTVGNALDGAKKVLFGQSEKEKEGRDPKQLFINQLSSEQWNHLAINNTHNFQLMEDLGSMDTLEFKGLESKALANFSPEQFKTLKREHIEAITVLQVIDVEKELINALVSRGMLHMMQDDVIRALDKAGKIDLRNISDDGLKALIGVDKDKLMTPATLNVVSDKLSELKGDLRRKVEEVEGVELEPRKFDNAAELEAQIIVDKSPLPPEELKKYNLSPETYKQSPLSAETLRENKKLYTKLSDEAIGLLEKSEIYGMEEKDVKELIKQNRLHLLSDEALTALGERDMEIDLSDSKEQIVALVKSNKLRFLPRAIATFGSNRDKDRYENFDDETLENMANTEFIEHKSDVGNGESIIKNVVQTYLGSIEMRNIDAGTVKDEINTLTQEIRWDELKRRCANWIAGADGEGMRDIVLNGLQNEIDSTSSDVYGYNKKVNLLRIKMLFAHEKDVEATYKELKETVQLLMEEKSFDSLERYFITFDSLSSLIADKSLPVEYREILCKEKLKLLEVCKDEYYPGKYPVEYDDFLKKEIFVTNLGYVETLVENPKNNLNVDELLEQFEMNSGRLNSRSEGKCIRALEAVRGILSPDGDGKKEQISRWISSKLNPLARFPLSSRVAVAVGEIVRDAPVVGTIAKAADVVESTNYNAKQKEINEYSEKFLHDSEKNQTPGRTENLALREFYIYKEKEYNKQSRPWKIFLRFVNSVKKIFHKLSMLLPGNKNVAKTGFDREDYKSSSKDDTVAQNVRKEALKQLEKDCISAAAVARHNGVARALNILRQNSENTKKSNKKGAKSRHVQLIRDSADFRRKALHHYLIRKKEQLKSEFGDVFEENKENKENGEKFEDKGFFGKFFNLITNPNAVFDGVVIAFSPEEANLAHNKMFGGKVGLDKADAKMKYEKFIGEMKKIEDYSNKCLMEIDFNEAKRLVARRSTEDREKFNDAFVESYSRQCNRIRAEFGEGLGRESAESDSNGRVPPILISNSSPTPPPSVNGMVSEQQKNQQLNEMNDILVGATCEVGVVIEGEGKGQEING
ncbi:hypothetical protein FACS1894152_5210 [Bacilli bacterium]|nr:hypothetical protein FACS1894152_5210 [Bacilli bacterium]